MKFTREELNSIFEFVQESFEGELGYKLITKDRLDPYIADLKQELGDKYKDIFELQKEALNKLENYKVKLLQDGEHKHDGQMVEYTFCFKNPNKEVTKIVTDMCLMVGWNHSDEEIIK